MIRTTMLATALFALATAAAAQDATPSDAPAPIVTRSAAPAAPAPTLSASSAAPAPDATGSQIAAWINADGDSSGKSVPGVVSAMPQRDRAIHGEVGASIGSGGYRSGYAIANMPIGEHSDVTVGHRRPAPGQRQPARRIRLWIGRRSPIARDRAQFQRRRPGLAHGRLRRAEPVEREPAGRRRPFQPLPPHAAGRWLRALPALTLVCSCANRLA